jgi:hypothetical protein
MTAAPHPDWTADWHDILAPHLRPGERILWQGQPEPGFHQPGQRVMQMIFGAVFLFGGGALASSPWTLSAPLSMGAWGGALAGACFALLGAYLFFNPIFGCFHVRTRYALTDRSAYILGGWPMRRVRVFPIRPWSPVRIEQGNVTATVWFHDIEDVDEHGQSYIISTGFENIADAPQVHLLLLNVKAQSE